MSFTLSPLLSALYPQPFTLSPFPSPLCPQPLLSALNPRPSTRGPRSSSLCRDPSTLSGLPSPAHRAATRHHRGPSPRGSADHPDFAPAGRNILGEDTQFSRPQGLAFRLGSAPRRLWSGRLTAPEQRAEWPIPCAETWIFHHHGPQFAQRPQRNSKWEVASSTVCPVVRRRHSQSLCHGSRRSKALTDQILSRGTASSRGGHASPPRGPSGRADCRAD